METPREKIIGHGIVNSKEIRLIEGFFRSIKDKKIEEITLKKEINNQERSRVIRHKKIQILQQMLVVIGINILYSLITNKSGFFLSFWIVMICLMSSARFVFFSIIGIRSIHSYYNKINQNISKTILSDFVKIFGNFSYQSTQSETIIPDIQNKIKDLASLSLILDNSRYNTEDHLCGNIQKNGRKIHIEGFEINVSSEREILHDHSYIISATFPDARYLIKNPITITTGGSVKISKKRMFQLYWFLGYLGVMLAMLDIAKYGFNKSNSAKQEMQLGENLSQKKIHIKCDNPSEAYTIVTPALEEKILKITQKYPNRIYNFCFYENKIHIKQSLSGSFFEITHGENTHTQPEDFLDFYIQFREILELIYDMNLFYYSKISLKN